jgi:23S rRNA (pseudouridine1915-N3)-methyltransferase
MKVTLILVGKTEDKWLQTGLEVYASRLKHYLPVTVVELPALAGKVKGDTGLQKEMEGKAILKALEKSDKIYLLDDKGEQYKSEDLAVFIQKQMNSSVKNLTFVIGGAFGFSPAVYQKANGLISLSKMTFTHQMVRLIFSEQLYRAMTIIRNESYHHA